MADMFDVLRALTVYVYDLGYEDAKNGDYIFNVLANDQKTIQQHIFDKLKEL